MPKSIDAKFYPNFFGFQIPLGHHSYSIDSDPLPFSRSFSTPNFFSLALLPSLPNPSRLLCFFPVGVEEQVARQAQASTSTSRALKRKAADGLCVTMAGGGEAASERLEIDEIRGVNRTSQLGVAVSLRLAVGCKLADNVFVTVFASVQYQALARRQAMLTTNSATPEREIQAYVFD
ncbi:Hypersensitive-induced response protein, partial [Dionaea muscipula]